MVFYLFLIAAKLEQTRFNNNIALIAKEYDEFKDNQTTDTYFNKKITNLNYSGGFVSVLEGLSFILLLIGVVIGLVNLVINREDLCDSKSNTQISCSSCVEQVKSTIAQNEKNNFSISIENNNQPPEN